MCDTTFSYGNGHRKTISIYHIMVYKSGFYDHFMIHDRSQPTTPTQVEALPKETEVEHFVEQRINI